MTSLRKAIDNMCKQCIYDPYPGNGTWRQQVGACTSKDCALFEVRAKPTPERLKKNEDSDKKDEDSGKKDEDLGKQMMDK